ncbi:SDR family NAD(P)-dependent oxidoreductase [Pseudorhodoplanes sp.]|uniref:SDR family NAD(P)-dependent oxidoreductase n=1 Tax=Pseudorhodoplanes sp. TaxID=1934341 RepID=UPI003D0999C9
MSRLNGKVAAITGAAGGLGRAVTMKMAQEGARLALIDLSEDLLAPLAGEVRDKFGSNVLTLAGDVTEEAPVREMFDKIHAHFSRVDVLVNNVGGTRNERLWEATVEQWDFTMKWNLRSMFLCTRAVLPGMMAQRDGRIICFSSGAREGTPWTAEDQGAAAYSTAKAGVHGFVRDAAWEVSFYGVRVNAVAPGPIIHPRVKERYERWNATLERSPKRMVPMGRYGEAHEVADAVVFLASDESSYITGVTLDVSGGRTG